MFDTEYRTIGPSLGVLTFTLTHGLQEDCHLRGPFPAYAVLTYMQTSL